MYIKIEYRDKEYRLSFDRKTAKDMSEYLSEMESEDLYERAAVIIAFALIKENPELSEEERFAIANATCEDYPITDYYEDEAAENEDRLTSGLLTTLNEMAVSTIPKGFTGRATKKFVVVKE